MADNDYDATRQPLLSGFNSLLPSDDEPRSRAYARRRDQAKVLLSSKTKHYVIMSLVALDVASILADILIALISCDMGEQEEPWVEVTREALHLVGLIFSSMFLVELLLTVWAFGLRYVGAKLPWVGRPCWYLIFGHSPDSETWACTASLRIGSIALMPSSS